MSKDSHIAHDGAAHDFIALGIKVLVVSDSRTLDTDKSGQYIEQCCRDAGHSFLERKIIADEAAEISACVAEWSASAEVGVVIVTGGTGVTPRDVTPEAVEPLFTKALAGFGELFRMLSYKDIGTSCIQSRATAGMVDDCIVFVIPGSTGACRLGMEEIILPQLDARTKPCSFAGLLNG
ncbi:MAG: molybdenum cofactor biosynthesis protein B [Planctomycetes bacterium]|nr:molybdenum cofactor biosynthesis protein B [Planctomycetota bacterium]MCP4771122.1 molybdenum cofactor biosynthesis protein B [Planctomycetota bacterium]MCP4860829.1 molybdenum cofactor biosynthesis protein B [Planctomycetota bacterium]